MSIGRTETWPKVLEYTQYRDLEAVIEKAKLACFNSVSRIIYLLKHVSKMIEIGHAPESAV